jgi:ribonuclease P protein component
MDSKPGSAPVDVPGSQTALSVLTVLTKRADFLRAARARRQAAPGFLLQARRRTDDEAVVSTARRVGFTCSKKVGNAVTRNRAKRRLRALARAVLAVSGQPGWDYVLVGRPEATVSRDFADLLTDLERAITAIHKPRSATGGTP